MKKVITTTAVLTLLACCSTAGAATVAKVGPTLAFTADDGEQNTVTVTEDSKNIIFEDSTAAAVAGNKCTQSGSKVTCPKSNITKVRLALFDQNDFGTTAGIDIKTVFFGASSDDFFVPGMAVGDVINGGNGTDTVDYSARTAPVTLTNDAIANDGEDGELDDIQPDVEVLIGGAGDDQIVGSAGDEQLDGGGGSDVILGGGGQDSVDTGPGADQIDVSGDKDSDIVTCGQGMDRVTADANDQVDTSCEEIAIPVTEPTDSGSAPNAGTGSQPVTDPTSGSTPGTGTTGSTETGAPTLANLTFTNSPFERLPKAKRFKAKLERVKGLNKFGTGIKFQVTGATRLALEIQRTSGLTGKEWRKLGYDRYRRYSGCKKKITKRRCYGVATGGRIEWALSGDGTQKVLWSGWVGNLPLKSGHYSVTAIAGDSQGKSAQIAGANITVLPPTSKQR